MTLEKNSFNPSINMRECIEKYMRISFQNFYQNIIYRENSYFIYVFFCYKVNGKQNTKQKTNERNLFSAIKFGHQVDPLISFSEVVDYLDVNVFYKFVIVILD